jgi:hypothetical protein
MKKLYPILVYLLLIAICISIVNLQNTKVKNNILTNEDKSDTITGIEIEVIKTETQDIRVQSEPTQEPPTIIIAEEETEDKMPEYDIPLSKELQEFTYVTSKQYNVPYELVLAVIATESNFKINAINENSETNADLGIMQINSIHKEIFKEKGFTDIFDPYQNIEYGISYLAELYSKFEGNEHYTLSAYNKGEYGFKELLKQGITSTKYSRKVMENKLLLNENIKGGEWYD